MLNISFKTAELDKAEAIAILVDDKLALDKHGVDIDQKHQNIVSKFLKLEQNFQGKEGEVAALNVFDQAGNIQYIFLIGTGDKEQIDEIKLEQLGGRVHMLASGKKISTVAVMFDLALGSFTHEQAAALVASGGYLAAYKFDKYFTDEAKKSQKTVAEIILAVADVSKAEEYFEHYKAIASGVYFARDLVSEAPNILFPESYANLAVEHLEPLGVEVEVLGERQMHALGMGAILGVGQGSAKESQIVIMKYNGKDEESKPVCLVGKGVTFDTGGISIKPAAGMDAMKYDMGGSAAVVGAIKALALRKAKVNVVGIVGLVENMPGSNAQRPGDIVTTMSGKTVEVLNTDAEGRLVLCDCITYIQEKFAPEYIIDLATLTGAVLIALANTYGGLFSNDNQLADDLIAAAEKTDEKLWRLPLHKDYDEMLKSTVADVANIGGERGMAGSATAAHFIGRFIDKGVKWAHLDIAGMAWDKKGKNPICPKGGVGFGVRLLNQFLKDYHEQS